MIRSSPGPEGKNQRLDIWLASRFTYRSRSEWQTAVRTGEILLNGTRTRPSRLLHGDEIIDFQVPDIPEPPVRTDYKILAEFPQYIVADKPGNLPVHPSGCFFNHTLLMLMRGRYGDLYPVNRIDRETSGIVLFAKSSDAAARLSSSFLRKKYLVYVHGVFPPGLFHASGWLSPDPESTVRKKRRFSFEKPSHAEAESCSTDFLNLHTGKTISKLECILHTGRLHQIRATLCSLGFPVAGDKLYGLDDTIFDRFSCGKMTERDQEMLLLERQALHAYELKLADPFDGNEKVFASPLPAELQTLERI